MTDVRVTATRYEVSVLPEDFEAGHMWTIVVEYRGRGLWAVLGGSAGRECLSADGAWDWEPLSSGREDDWLATHRFPLERALELAREHAPKIVRSTRFGAWTAYDAMKHENRKQE